MTTHGQSDHCSRANVALLKIKANWAFIRLGKLGLLGLLSSQEFVIIIVYAFKTDNYIERSEKKKKQKAMQQYKRNKYWEK